MKTLICSLVMLVRPGEILLARGKIGVSKGYFNGYGGKQGENETIGKCAIRELKEESRAIAKIRDLQKVGILRFIWELPPKEFGVPEVKTVEVHTFLLSKWTGEPRETLAFGPPEWFAYGDVPYADMLPGEEKWLPRVLGDEFVEVDVHYYYDESGKICIRETPGAT